MQSTTIKSGRRIFIISGTFMRHTLQRHRLRNLSRRRQTDATAIEHAASCFARDVPIRKASDRGYPVPLSATDAARQLQSTARHITLAQWHSPDLSNSRFHSLEPT